MFNMKSGTLKFIINASLDTLPTRANLVQWGKRTSDLCKLCLNNSNPDIQGRRKETTAHILNGCKVSLNQLRYTWRHNNILHYICQKIDKEKFTFYADLPNHQLPNGGTIPENLCTTNKRPDLVIIDERKQEITIFELTVPLETNIETAHTQKQEKYSSLTQEMPDKKVKIIPFEIGSRGYISRANKVNLRTLNSFCKDTSLKTFSENISNIAQMSSFYIFNNRNTYEWDPNTPPIKPVFN